MSESEPSGRSASELIDQRIAALDDPTGLFNASLDGNARRAIDFTRGATVDEAAFTALVRAAVALNTMPRIKR